MNKDCAIFIAARDNYSDTWDIFFLLFFRYWPDCPFQIYLVSEKKIYQDDRIININVKEDVGTLWEKQWAGRMKYVLKKINKPYLIFFHTDYLLTNKVDTDRILKFVDIIKDEKKNIGYIRLNPSPPPRLEYIKDKTLGIISKTDNYAISMQVTLWKTKFFEKLLIDGYSPVDLEIICSKMSVNMSELFLSVKSGKTAISYLNGIKKGVWSYDSIRFIKKEKKDLILKRGVEKYRDYILRITGISSFFQKIKRITLKKLYYFLKNIFN